MLVCENLSKQYKNQKRKAVDSLNLTISPGKIFGFLGPNGAGKSTTIKMIVGLLRPDSGTISLDGISLLKDDLAYKRIVGYVADEPLFYERMTALEHLLFIAGVYQIDQHERDRKIEELSTLLLLSDVLNQQIASYSHGMKQKLAVISALLHQPRLLILDEPMVGLDPKASYLLKQLLKEYSNQGNTVFFSTHVLEVAQNLCDTLGIIDEGNLRFCGSFSQLQQASSDHDGNLEQLFLDLTEERR